MSKAAALPAGPKRFSNIIDTFAFAESDEQQRRVNEFDL
tara:strand:+ start:372 stop:488 length:117 start_codon:yes stop_codon:yes gene_type:complete